MNQRIESGISRRTFVKAASTAAGSLLVGIHLPASSEQKRMPLQQTVMNSFIRIDNDNTITLLANHSEFGNGAYTIMPMMVAEHNFPQHWTSGSGNHEAFSDKRSKRFYGIPSVSK